MALVQTAHGVTAYAPPPLTVECECESGYRIHGDGDPCSRWHRDARPCWECAGTTRAANVVTGGACASCATYPENPPQRAEPGTTLCRECGLEGE